MAQSRTNWLRCLLVTGLCYCLFAQTLLVQAAGIVAAAPQPVICHGIADGASGDADNDNAPQCHFCWLPASGVTLLPDLRSSLPVPVSVAASGYSVFSAPIGLVRPPPRGASRAPPSLA